MLPALITIASDQTVPTENKTKKTLKFLNYVTTHPYAILTYSASNMILNVHSNALYLCEPKAKSRAGGHFFLSNNEKYPRGNGAVLNIAKKMKNVMSLAAEAKIGSLFLNSRQALPARTTLIEMGHQHLPTSIKRTTQLPWKIPDGLLFSNNCTHMRCRYVPNAIAK